MSLPPISDLPSDGTVVSLPSPALVDVPIDSSSPPKGVTEATSEHRRDKLCSGNVCVAFGNISCIRLTKAAASSTHAVHWVELELELELDRSLMADPGLPPPALIQFEFNLCGPVSQLSIVTGRPD